MGYDRIAAYNQKLLGSYVFDFVSMTASYDAVPCNLDILSDRGTEVGFVQGDYDGVPL